MAGGTGLGLYSLLKRVEALGGEVFVTDYFVYIKKN
jgi:signal transduction histidine kinase